MTSHPRPLLAAVTTLLLAALALAACTSDDPQPAPTVTPTASPTAEATPTASPTLPSPVALSSLALPEQCYLVDEGRWDPRIQVDVPVRIEFSTAPCARETLAALGAGGAALRVQWTPVGFDHPATIALFSQIGETGGWEGTATFRQPGTWRTDSGLGIFFDVLSPPDFKLARPSPDLPLPAAPQTVAVLDGAANEILRTFSAERGGLGFLRNPDRVVFVDTHDGDRWLVTGDIETGQLEPLFPVGLFANVYSAPDGRAVAVEWGLPNGRRQLRILTAAGHVTAIDDSSISFISVDWAPDSSTLLARGDSLWVLDSDGAVRHQQALDERARPLPIWSPDSTYVLLWYSGSNQRLTRLDIASLEEQAIFADPKSSFGLPAIAPDGDRFAVSWWDGAAVHLAVAPLNDLAGASLQDHIVASFSVPQDAYSSFGGLSWSPDGRLLALAATGLPIDGAAPAFGSLLAVLDPATGELHRVAEAPDYYVTWAHGPAWSADASTLFASRFNCTACEATSSAVDVIDVAQRRVVETFERSSYLGHTTDATAQLLTTPQGLLRIDGHGHQAILHPSPGGISFGPPAIQLADPSGAQLLAVQIGVGQGQQLFTARSDGSDLTPLGVLELNLSPYALLDSSTVVVRDRHWARYHLDTGLQEPYSASGDASGKYDFTLSPSGRLAVDRDSEGFAILDAATPNAPAIVPYREYPGAVVGLPVWSLDERRLAFANGDAIAVFDIESGTDHVVDLTSLPSLPPGDTIRHEWALTWTPAGELLFATISALWRLDLESDTATPLVVAPDPGSFGRGTVLSYSPDGQTLVAVTGFGVYAIDAAALTTDDSPAWRQLGYLGVPASGGALYWSPDSSALVVGAASDYLPEGIIVVPLDGSGAYRLVAPGSVRLLGWLPDGRIAWVATTGGI